MAKEDKQILVVETKHLFGEDKKDYFQGFRTQNEINYEERLLGNIKSMRRGSTKEPKDHPLGNAELNFDHKQPIGYMLIVNPITKEVYAYQRASKDEHYSEKRLQGKWSWGVGGHIEPLDHSNGNNVLIESRLRELEEEIEIIGNIIDSKVLGYVNDDLDEVGKVHFGILYLIEIDGNVKPKDKEMAFGGMLSLSELEERCQSKDCEVENWSKIALEPLKKYLS